MSDDNFNPLAEPNLRAIGAEQRVAELESGLASERAKRVEAEQEREIIKENWFDFEEFMAERNRALAAEATIEQVREWRRTYNEYGVRTDDDLVAILANADTAWLAQHDAEVAAHALEEVADRAEPVRGADFARWLRSRAAEKRAEHHETKEES